MINNLGKSENLKEDKNYILSLLVLGNKLNFNIEEHTTSLNKATAHISL